MSINNLPEDIVKHEIMEYLKPAYKVVEVTYIQITSKIDISDNDIELDTSQNVRTGLFKISQKTTDVYEFNPFNCYMSKKTLERMDEIRKNGEIATFHTEREQYFHDTFVYMSHTIVCS